MNLSLKLKVDSFVIAGLNRNLFSNLQITGQARNDVKRLVVVLVMLFNISAFATSIADPNIKYKEANTLYAAGNYQEAAAIYNELIVEDNLSAEIYYNLGNAYFKLNQVPQAILNYERALNLKPDFEDAIFNLKQANFRTVDKIERLPELFIGSAYKNLIRSRTSSSWAYYSVGLFFVALFLLVSYLLTSTLMIKKTGFYGGLLMLVMGFFCWFMAYQNQELINQSTEAIIFAETVTVNSEPNTTSQKLFTLHEGTKVNVLDKSNDWVKIKLPNGNVGWLNSKELEVI